jgi:hypothetical protein
LDAASARAQVVVDYSKPVEEVFFDAVQVVVLEYVSKDFQDDKHLEDALVEIGTICYRLGSTLLPRK